MNKQKAMRELNAMLKSDVFYDVLNERITEEYEVLDLLGEHVIGMKLYTSNRSGYGLVCNVKTSIGFKNEPDNSLDYHILNNYINDTFYENTWRYEDEFNYMSDSFRDVGELVCVGRSGGYWGFAKIDFDDPITPDIAQILKNIDKHKLLEQVSFNNDSTLYSDEHDIAELIFNSISINDYAVINPTLASRLDEFVVRCKKLVDYYEDANNLLAEAEEDDYTFERIISTQDAIVDNDSNLLIISTINDHIIESVYNTTTKAVEYNYDDTVKSSTFINNIMQVVKCNVMEQIKHLTDIAKVIK